MKRERSLRGVTVFVFFCILCLPLILPGAACAVAVNAGVVPTWAGSATCVISGDTANCTITKIDGYVVSSVTSDKGSLTFSQTSATVTGLPSKGTVTVTFILLPAFTVIGSVATPGSITCPAASYDNGTKCDCRAGGGSTCTFNLSCPTGEWALPTVTAGTMLVNPAPSGDSYIVSSATTSGSVNFTCLPVHHLTVTVGSNGSVSPSGSPVQVVGDAKTFTITPAPGYGIKSVLADGVAVPCTNGQYTFTGIDSDNHTLEVQFDKAYTIHATSGENGAIYPAGAVKVVTGGRQSFGFTPASGYAVDTLVVDGVQISAAEGFSFSDVEHDHTIAVSFKPSGPTLRSYCNAPPFAPSGIKANLLLMIDNSSSMYDLAYTGSDYCLESGYDGSRSYSGYFNEEVNYSYDFGAEKFSLFPGSVPTGCTSPEKSYLCLDIEAGGNVTRFVAGGRFLNWLATSKLDLEKKVLTGGKFNVERGYLEGESRGCQGKRFVKMVDDGFPITFAVRAPLPSEVEDYEYQSGGGGGTRIEIYHSRYNKTACQLTADDWGQGVTLERIEEDISACLNNPVNTGIPAKKDIFYQVMPICYSYLQENQQLPSRSTLEGLYTNCLSYVGAGRGNDSDTVCTASASHVLHKFARGFLGECMTSGMGGGWLVGDHTRCQDPQTEDFCVEIKQPTVTDPSYTAVSGKNANFSSFVLDAGVSGMGSACGPKPVKVRVALDAPPTGQIQAFAHQINFGAMIFNDNGGGTECKSSPGEGEIPCLNRCSGPLPLECHDTKDSTDCPTNTVCTRMPRTDGGRIISYLNHSPLGDHSPKSGLIAAIDDVKASAWTPFAEAFYNAIGYFANRSDLRLHPDDFDTQLAPSQFTCQKNNILIISDGMSTADLSSRANDLAALYVPSGATGGDDANRCPTFSGSRSLDDLAWIAHNRNIKKLSTSSASPADPQPLKGSQSITTHVIYTGASTSAPGQCDPYTLMHDTAASGGGIFTSSHDPSDLDGIFRSMLQAISSGSNSGSEASLLSAGSGDGALFLQPLFSPQKSLNGGLDTAAWTGELQALWYYTDPAVGISDGTGSTIREDTGYSGGDHFLDLDTDRAVTFSYDAGTNITNATLFTDADGDGRGEEASFAENADLVQSIWRGGVALWKRNSGRTIYTDTDGATLTDFLSLDTASAANRTLLQAAGPGEAQGIIGFVAGEDAPGARAREIDASGKVWKLGDIVSCAPKAQTPLPLNNYQIPPPLGYNDASYRRFVTAKAPGPLPLGTYDYANRGTVYVGANDGMLHAFRMGKVRGSPSAADGGWLPTRKAALSGSLLGQEEWGFVPGNALPYLKYLKDPSYTHLYFVDGSITLADVSIGRPAACGSEGDYWDCLKDYTLGSNWRTVLIGGMGLGGASRGASDSCSDRPSGSCVKAPLDTAGLSSYFALDVTSQGADGSGAPALMWEFAHQGLGFATSGGAVLKINARTGASHSHEKNGRWFAVFASGPTGPIDCDSCKFMGTSDQRLKFFVVDLNATPPLVEGSNYWQVDTGIENAFAGSIVGGGIDADKWNTGARGYYEDDALYVGYTAKGGGNSWDSGGVVRLVTKEDPNPANWRASKVIEGIGPVTGGIGKIQDRNKHKLWLYFGTGRYWHNQDDMGGARALYGITEPCYVGEHDSLDPACSAPRTLSELTDKSSDASDRLDTYADKGWFVNLDPADGDGGFGGERVLSPPTPTSAGAVFFSSFKPSTDSCAQGGDSYLWEVKYDTGGMVPPLSGKALVPLSTGSLAEVNGTLPDKGGRRSGPMTGKPGGVKFVSNSGLRPLKRILHIQER